MIFWAKHTLTGQGVWWLVVLEGVREQCNRGAECSLGTVWPAGRTGQAVFRVYYSGGVWENEHCWWEIGEIEGLSD